MTNLPREEDLVIKAATNAADVLLLALSYGKFENVDIAGQMASLLSSLSSDLIISEHEASDTTISVMDDLVETMKAELDDIAGRLDDEEEDLPETDSDDNNDDEDEDDEDEDDLPEVEVDNDTDEDEDEDKEDDDSDGLSDADKEFIEKLAKDVKEDVSVSTQS